MPCSREEALEIAIKYLGKQHIGELELFDKPPDDLFYGDQDEIRDSWAVYVPSYTTIGASRFILIAKSTGNIVVDQSVGE